MATAFSDLLTRLDQNLILQLKEIVRSDLDFEKLSAAQITALNTAALSIGLPTPLAAFIEFSQHPERLGLPPKSKEDIEKTTNITQVIAANVDLYLLDKDALEKINAQIETKLAKERKTVRDQVKRLVALEVARRQAEILSLRAKGQTVQNLRNIAADVDRKRPPLLDVAAISADLIEAALPQIESQLGLTISDQQKEGSIQNLTTIIIAGTATGAFDLTKPEHRDEAIEIALADIPTFHSTTVDVYRQVEQIVIPTATPQFNSPIPSRIQVAPDILVTGLETITAPEPAPIITLAFPPDFEEKTERVKALSAKFVSSVSANNASDEVMADLTRTITPTQRQQFISVALAANLVTRVAPTKDGAAAKVVIGEINQPNSKTLDKTALELYAMGFALANAKKIIAENPNVLKQLEATYQQLDGSKLGTEIRPPPLSGPAATYQTLTNRLSGFLPGRASQIFNAVTHPFQFIQGKVGNFIGKQAVGKLKSFLLEKVGTKIANESFKKAAEFVLEKGLQEGLKKVANFAIAKIGGTALVAGLSAALGISTGGVSLVIQAAVMAAVWVGEKVFGVVKNIANGLARALTGEDFDWKPLAAAPLLLLSGAGALLGSLGAATSIAAMSAGVALVISALVGFFLYITVITVAPIITTIAHLESGLGPQQGAASGAFPFEPYTGPILPGCPQIWPFSGGYIIQGPHGTYSHASVEAVDIYTNIGTPVKSVSSGTVTVTGWGDAYGNWIQVRSATQAGKAYTVLYAHLSEIGVQVGDPVGVGTVIALSGATSSVPGFANPHLHLEYRGLIYNSCPAGGIQIPEGCYSAIIGKPNACLIGGQPIYTN